MAVVHDLDEYRRRRQEQIQHAAVQPQTGCPDDVVFCLGPVPVWLRDVQSL
jgi:hypothetical protein